MANKKEELDKFWDIKELIPAKKPPSHTPQKKILTTEIVINDTTDKVKEENKLNFKRITPSEQKPAPKFKVYENFSSLIKKITVYNWSGEYNYYDLFCRQARFYQNVTPVECVHEHFFSYMPQYSQMNKKQLDWYFWWRKNVNQGIYLDTDSPYILLYVFELINTSTESTAKTALETMINLWSNYSDMYPQIDKTLGEWICDFSMIHQIPIAFPDNRITQNMISGTAIPEVFYNFDYSDLHLLAKFLLTYCNSYNYRKSKFYNDSTKSVYETHILASFEKLLAECDFKNKLFSESEKKVTRIAYMGALCNYQAKKRLEIVYASPKLEVELKTYVSCVIKYIENILRSALGVRSKLGIKNIDPRTKQIIDSYFSKTLGNISENNIIKPDYEKLYDVKFEEFSVERANEIESKSWDVTKKLVEAFEAPKAVDPVIENIVIEDKKILSENTPLANFYDAISNYKHIFDLIKNEKYSEQISYAKENKLILEAVIDEINEIATEIFEDILIEENDIGYKIINEYKSLLDE